MRLSVRKRLVANQRNGSILWYSLRHWISPQAAIPAKSIFTETSGRMFSSVVRALGSCAEFMEANMECARKKSMGSAHDHILSQRDL